MNIVWGVPIVPVAILMVWMFSFVFIRFLIDRNRERTEQRRQDRLAGEQILMRLREEVEAEEFDLRKCGYGPTRRAKPQI
jgi:hypothetical protein